MSRTLAAGITAFARLATAWQRPFRRSNTLLRVVNALHQHHSVATPHGLIHFVSTHPQALDYPTGVFSREPETIAWLDTLDAQSVLWDIGANVGLYSLYAARKGARVWAFEPAPASYAALAENVRVNGLHRLVSAVPVALGKETCLGRLAMSAMNPGSVHHSLVDETPGFYQAAVTFSADDFRDRFKLPFPTHLKIDVDGIEPDILRGASAVLAARELKLVSVEVNDGQFDSISRLLTDAGFDLAQRVSDPTHPNAIFVRKAY